MLSQTRSKGITLIALVITIIVLLILAGIVISLTLGENGIINKSKNAGKTYDLSSIKEQIQMEILGRIDNDLSVLDSDIIDILKKYAGEKGQVVYENGKPVGVNPNQYPEDTIWLNDIWNGNKPKDPISEIVGDGSFVNGVNTPKLRQGMTAIVYDASKTGTSDGLPAYWKEATTEAEWYSYKNNQWANAVTEDGSMWVWIPRYEYEIVGKTININFIPTSTTQKTGTITNGYRIHPAFEDGSSKGKDNNYMNGEWDSELSGIWVAKFEASREDSKAGTQGTSDTVKIQPNTKSWISITIGDSYTKAQAMYTKYNSHLMKNSEWGAVVYLTQSKFGRSETEVTINDNTSIVTGAGDYITNINQSSTNNTSGIYDLNGGAWERVAGYITNGDTNLSTNGSSLVGTNLVANENGYLTLSTRETTVYPYNRGSDIEEDNWTVYDGLKTDHYGYGDAVLETSTAGNSLTSWNGDFSSFPNTSGSFFTRGGAGIYGSKAGMFAYSGTSGSANVNDGFRPVLAF